MPWATCIADLLVPLLAQTGALPTDSVQGSPFCTSSSEPVSCCLLGNSHPHRNKAISHGGFPKEDTSCSDSRGSLSSHNGLPRLLGPRGFLLQLSTSIVQGITQVQEQRAAEQGVLGPGKHPPAAHIHPRLCSTDVAWPATLEERVRVLGGTVPTDNIPSVTG